MRKYDRHFSRIDPILLAHVNYALGIRGVPSASLAARDELNGISPGSQVGHLARLVVIETRQTPLNLLAVLSPRQPGARPCVHTPSVFVPIRTLENVRAANLSDDSQEQDRKNEELGRRWLLTQLNQGSFDNHCVLIKQWPPMCGVRSRLHDDTGTTPERVTLRSRWRLDFPRFAVTNRTTSPCSCHKRRSSRMPAASPQSCSWSLQHISHRALGVD